MHEVLVNRLGGLSLPRKSVVRITDRPDMTLDVYHGRKTTMQQLSFCATSDSVLGWPCRGLTGGFLLLQNFSVAISVSPHVCFILVLILISMFLR